MSSIKIILYSDKPLANENWRGKGNANYLTLKSVIYEANTFATNSCKHYRTLDSTAVPVYFVCAVRV